METRRVLLAVLISFAILLGYQYFLMPPPPSVQEHAGEALKNVPVETPTPKTSLQNEPAATAEGALPFFSPPSSLSASQKEQLPALENFKDVSVETSLYKTIISEASGGIKSFTLKNYRESIQNDAAPKELIKTDSPLELPLFFSWGVEPAKAGLIPLKADKEMVTLSSEQNQQTITLSGKLPTGVELVRTYTFSDQNYLIELTVELHNPSDKPVQGAPYITLTNRPFDTSSNTQNVFSGPTVFYNAALKQIKTEDISATGLSLIGKIGWIAYEDTYFMTSIIPGTEGNDPAAGNLYSAFFTLLEKDKVNSILAGVTDTLDPGAKKYYHYTVYFGPKKLTELKKVGRGLEKIIDFGWWDFIAKPTLFMLNFLHQYIHNYGIAIILITILIKLLFWPISQKGMQSMKTMQKLQPKMTKLREKYKDDKERLNQEMLQLYKTYKVNPVGGCLPMVLQIPVFFALYKVLLQTIELRHAPFMLWINDLSAPDRLHIGIDIPYLGGIPILTLFMGGSMYLQQKLSPPPADPAQATMMKFLPIVFTFMFVNFASGLVLYWFVNNLLSIAQQYLVNQQAEQ